jgi:hypothetical protein
MAEIVIKLVNGDLAGQTAQTLSKNYNEAALAAKKAAIGTQEWVDAQAKLGDAKKLLQDNKDQIEATTKASGSLKQSFLGILDQIPGFSQIRSAMQGATSGVGGLTSGFGFLKGAIAATGIGLLVLAVTTLVMWFSKTEVGANVLGGSMRAIGAIVNVLFGKLMEIGKALFAAFQNPKQLLIDLVDFIGNNLLNRLKAFVVIWDGIKNFDLKKVTDGFIQLGTGVTNATDKLAALGNEIGEAAKEGYNFVQVMDDIEDRQAAMEVTAKKNENLVNQLLLQAKNVGKTFEDRIAILDKADAITRKSYAAQLSLSAEYLKAVNAEIDAEKKQQGVTEDTDEMRDKRKDAELKYLEIQGQGIELEEKIANRREQILGKQEKADEKTAAAEKKRLEDEEKARQNILELRASDQEKGEKQEIDSILAATKGKIDALVGSESQITEQRALLEDIAQRQIQAVKDKYAEEAAKNLRKQLDVENETKLTAEVAILNDKFLAGQISNQQYVALSEKAVRDSEQRKLAIIKQSVGTQTKEYQDQFKKILDQDAKFAEQHAKQVTQATASTASTLANVFGELAAMQNQGSEAAKELMVAQAIMATISGSINAYTSTAQIPIVGPILAPIAAAVAFATGISNVNKIKNTPLPKQPAYQKAQYGMVLSGPSHADGGINVNAEGDELIMTKGVYRDPMLRSIASRLNVAGGGISFETGGPVNPYSDASRAPMASNAANNRSGSDLIDYNKLAAFMDAQMDKKIKTIKVINVATETEATLKTINDIKAEANA